jgi:hypothetical protein
LGKPKANHSTLGDVRMSRVSPIPTTFSHGKAG